jgi:hypothetical protein
MSASKPTPNPDVAVAYIRDNFKPADRLALVVLNKRTTSVTQRIAATEKIMEPDFQSWLRYRNDRDRCEIYISMNALHPNAQGRTKQDVARIRHIYLDFDADGTAAVERLLKRQDTPKPNYLINSSPDKWQVVWKVEGFGKEQAEQLQRGLARDAGADPAATDCSRVLRLPGFHNHKYRAPYLIRMESLAGETYGPNHFPSFSPEERLNLTGAPGSERRRSRGNLSQSERDWSFAKRALARGEVACNVIAAIANHRRFDKPNPQYYAELTVRKAEQALRIESRIPQEPERR